MPFFLEISIFAVNDTHYFENDMETETQTVNVHKAEVQTFWNPIRTVQDWKNLIQDELSRYFGDATYNAKKRAEVQWNMANVCFVKIIDLWHNDTV